MLESILLLRCYVVGIICVENLDYLGTSVCLAEICSQQLVSYIDRLACFQEDSAGWCACWRIRWGMHGGA